MSKIEDGGPAFPVQDAAAWQGHGMTLRQYAAIKLRVPNSGTDWLDEMIRDSLRDEFAEKAMAAYITSQIDMTREDTSPFAEEVVARISYQFADAMLAAREAA